MKEEGRRESGKSAWGRKVKKIFRKKMDIKAHYLRVGVGRHHSSTIFDLVFRVELQEAPIDYDVIIPFQPVTLTARCVSLTTQSYARNLVVCFLN